MSWTIRAVGTATLVAMGVPAAEREPRAECTPTGAGVCRYVDPAGNDADPGTRERPYRTLQKAADAVGPGDMVIVRSGSYTGGSIILEITRSGTPVNPIVFAAEHKWGAVIDGRDNRSAVGIEIRGFHVRVQGFEVRGTSHYGIEAYRGGNVTVAQNHVHDVGRYCTSTTAGIAGINAYVSNLVIEQNLVHDIGRYADGERGCATTNTNWQNHDHGIYHGIGDNVVIRNNVFYNLTRGWAIHRYEGSRVGVRNLEIVNNTFAGANPEEDGQIIIASPVSGLVIANNIFYRPRGGGVRFETGWLSGTVANNLTFGAGLCSGTAKGLVFAGNLIDVDPRFVNPARQDFRLEADSPARGAGRPLPDLRDDFDRSARPAGPPDLGAYQFR